MKSPFLVFLLASRLLIVCTSTPTCKYQEARYRCQPGTLGSRSYKVQILRLDGGRPGYPPTSQPNQVPRPASCAARKEERARSGVVRPSVVGLQALRDMVNLRCGNAAAASCESQSDGPILWKEQGNKAFEERDFLTASRMYHEGIEACGADDKEILVQLHSNLALCLVKLRRFDEATNHCDFVLDRLKASSPKVLYRRAVSRHGQATTRSGGASKMALLHHARNDLLRARNSLSGSSEPSSVAMLLVVERALLQTDVWLKNLELRVREDSFPSPDEQRRLVLQLFRSCPGIKKNSAFYLIDWKWWCTWCQFVQFDMASAKVVQLVATGAQLPRDMRSLDDIPGAIDNSNLLLRETSCLSQWYAPCAGEPRLKSCLVRGYHFEALPREVYYALKTWYGETTSSICRRADSKIWLYPITTVPAPPASRCDACRSPLTKFRCHRCNARYCDLSCQVSHWPFHRRICRGTTRTERQPVGLTNLGNTCFMNSALQVLSHTSPLTRYFLSSQYVRDLNKSNPLGTGGKLAIAYYDILRNLWMSSAVCASPISLKRKVAAFTPRFAGYLQHDSQEFLTCLLDGLHEDLNRTTTAQFVASRDTDGNSRNMLIAGAQAWDTHMLRNDSFVFRTFYGLFKSTCVCPDCKGVSNSFDTFNHVPLQIPQRSQHRVTLERCLDDFVKPERLDEQNLWYCSRCRNHVPATKTIELWRLPNVLILQLKRFNDTNAMRREKNQVLVDFPTDCLDLRNYAPAIEENQICDPSIPAVYDLFGVINHFGRLGFGHYTAVAREWDDSSLSPLWTLFDDSKSRRIEESETLSDTVVTPAAYVLCYRRRVFH